MEPTPRNRPPLPLDVRGFVATRPDGFRLRVDALTVAPGEAVVVAGPSGSGKSTLLGALVAHPAAGDPLTWTGAVDVLGTPWPARGSPAWRDALRGPVCVVPQDAQRALDPLRRLGAQVGALAGEGRDAVDAALARLGIDVRSGVAERHPHEVSGGQAQRALLAIALLRRARLCVLDEPSAGLDGPRVADLVRALDALRGGPSRTALLVATHDTGLVTALGARALHVAGGRLEPGSGPAPPWPEVGPAASGRPVVAACRGLGVGRGRATLVARADLEIHAGESVALVGPSGAGKSTVGRALAGLERARAGRVERPARPRAVQMLFQDAGGSLTPTRTLRSLVREVAVADFDVDAEAARLGLAAAALDRPAAALSGGEQRRGALLRALAVRPELLVLDEPTAALDRAAAVRVVATLLDVHVRTGTAMLWISHDDTLARAVCHRVVTMEGGQTCSRP